ncbi:MAG: head-tail adaptor protein [Pyramidobacter porci]|uniref:head-tail adaptor protein n=1 Tax=Pyramidobacter porci TaxID=2605789 RepID=UPI002A74F155|nr:head-tail adaptor protein [Pyramidobacter porci]MDY2649152.1 head-tail adaptor protein [Pyramidobacter porci]
MRAGQYRDRVEHRRVAKIKDAMGGFENFEQRLGFRWANVAVPKARDNILAMQGVELRTHVVTVRDRPGVPQMGDILICRGLRLRVLAARPDPANACVYLDCESAKP